MSATRNMKFRFLAVAIIVLIASFALVNCGGGGGDDAAQTTTTTTTTTNNNSTQPKLTGSVQVRGGSNQSN